MLFYLTCRLILSTSLNASKKGCSNCPASAALQRPHSSQGTFVSVKMAIISFSQKTSTCSPWLQDVLRLCPPAPNGGNAQENKRSPLQAQERKSLWTSVLSDKPLELLADKSSELFNELPDNVRNISTLSSFKKASVNEILTFACVCSKFPFHHWHLCNHYW